MTPASRSEGAPPASFRRFVVRSWEGELAGCTFVEVRGDGSARVLDGGLERGGAGALVPVFRLSEVKVDDAAIAALAALIETSGFRDLPARHAAEGDDGLSQDFLLEDDSGVKRIHCENELPAPLPALEAFVRDRILLPHKDQRAAAPPLTRDQAEPLCESVLPAE